MNRHLITALLASTLSLSAFAQDNLDWSKGWYIGVGVNNDAVATMTNGQVDSLPIIKSDPWELEATNIGFDVYLGREISKYWAAEAGYTFVGNVSLEGEINEERVQSATIKQWNIHLVGLGRLPIGHHMNFMVKGGTAWYFNSEKLHDIPAQTTTHNDYRGFALTYGAGLEVTWDQFVVRGEYTVLSPATNILEDFYVTDLIGLSMIYKFI